MTIRISNPYTELIGIVGMRQTGKTTLLAYLLKNLKARYICFDTLGVLTRHGFTPSNQKSQKVFFPNFQLRQQQLFKMIRKYWDGEGKIIFAIDEINMYQTKYQIPTELDVLVSLGGNKDMSLIWTSRRVAEVHNNIIANTTHHFIFKTFLPTDVDWYSQFIPKDVILLSKNLLDYHFIYYRIGSDPIICKPIPNIL